MNINNVYFPTWEKDLDWGGNSGESTLARIPSYITHVTLSFLRPDLEGFDLNKDMNRLFYDGNIPLYKLKDEIFYCKKNGGKSRVVLASVGGEIAGNFDKVNYCNLVDSIIGLGLDGIDIDYEPNGVMTQTEDEVNRYCTIISSLRYEFDKRSKITGKKYLISCAPTGVGLFSKDKFEKNSNKYLDVISRLKGIVPIDEQGEELKIGVLGDDNILKQPNYFVGSLASVFNFDSAGKMLDVFLMVNKGNSLNDYQFIGQMVDIVFYQAYNIGSGNILSRIMCYEEHRELSDYFNSVKDGSGFIIGHGSHVGKEAWPHFSFTKKRMGYIYTYINKFGRNGDGASFWSYFSSVEDSSDYLPNYGMGYKKNYELFKHVSSLLDIEGVTD